MRSGKLNHNRVALWLMALAVLSAVTACKQNAKQPDSSKQPYEVVVAGDATGLLAQVLQTDAECLPQPEPQFDVRKAPRLEGYYQYCRAIVVPTPTTFHVAYNQFAHPQIVVYARPADSLMLRATLRGFENNVQSTELRHQLNADAMQQLKRRLGVSLVVPMEMTASQYRRNFAWLSNNQAAVMTNLVVFRVPCNKTTVSAADIEQLRNRVLGKYIKGETNRMYMSTVPGSVRQMPPVVLKGKLYNRLPFFEGLWQMEHDAMGGPFVCRVKLDAGHHQLIYAEGFVYGPGYKKRNAIRRLEAVLYTLK